MSSPPARGVLVPGWQQGRDGERKEAMELVESQMGDCKKKTQQVASQGYVFVLFFQRGKLLLTNF